MDKKKNSKKWGTPLKLNINEKSSEIQKSKKEQAATLQNSKEESIPIFARPYDKETTKKKFGKENSKLRHYKPIIAATISAIAIGSFLGFMMLKMFVIIDNDLSANGNGNLPVASVDDNKDEDKPIETSSHVLEPISAFVLQGGVFSEKENADEWAAKYEQEGLAAVIWEKENQYYLLAGLASTEDQAKQLASGLSGNGLDIFVKEWTTSEVEAELTDEEKLWLQSFRDQWQQTLKATTSKDGLLKEEWQNIIANYPAESEKLSSLSEMIEGSIEEMESADKMKAHYILLTLWQHYEKVLQ